MTEKSRRFLYRLYGLAECTYYYVKGMETEEVRPSKVWGMKPSIVVNEEPEDQDGDQWTMFKEDYDMIREIMEFYDDNTDWITIEVVPENNPFVTMTKCEELKDGLF